MNKIAFFADHIAHWQAGTEGQMLMLASGLAEKGWTVPLFVLRDSDAAQDGRWPGPVTELDSRATVATIGGCPNPSP